MLVSMIAGKIRMGGGGRGIKAKKKAEPWLALPLKENLYHLGGLDLFPFTFHYNGKGKNFKYFPDVIGTKK
jgi:hypothetical protein